MRRLEPKPLALEAYKRLLKLLLDGSFQAGARLREERLCERLGVSRTPVREAMIRLEREGILERRPNRGFIVKERDASETAELFKCRSMFEALALKEGFRRLDKGKISKLLLPLGKLTAKDGKEELRKAAMDADDSLHALIADSCGNRFLAAYVRQLQAQCAPYRIHRCEASSPMEAVQERRLILEAMRDGKLPEASKLLERHFSDAAKLYAERTEAD